MIQSQQGKSRNLMIILMHQFKKGSSFEFID